MVQKIALLPEAVINKIAAGEVVENPGSILKELVENSIDAGASRIEIFIEGGGEKLIRVEDDGCGMGPEDAPLSLERHATSKIQTERDLQTLATMGFRGEALAAIASVSQFELRTSEGGAGVRIAAEGGRVLCIEPTARNRGTTIEVRSLFFNVPARKKFMKSASSNLAQAIRMIETIAMAYPEIAFIFQSEGRAAIEMFPEEKKKRVEGVLGSMPHEVRSEALWGLLAPAAEAKLQRRGQYLFVNRRAVFSPLISKAVKAGYGTRIAENAYPSFALFLHLPPEEIDVNVHPQKKEIRFADEKKIFRLCERAAAAAFETAPQFMKTLSFSEPCLFSEAVPPPFFPSPAPPLEFDFPKREQPLAIIEEYFLLETEEILLIDLRAVRARVLFESLKEKKMAAQTLLWPIEVAVDCEKMEGELQALGIECRMIGRRMLAIDALPSLLDPSDFAEFFFAWKEGKRLDVATSRYARGAKRRFSLEEALFLWKELQKCQETRYDPVGKRIWERLDRQRLKRILEDGTI